MKTLYLDCSMGAAGDMLTAALVDLLPEPDKFIDELNALGIPDVKIAKQSAVKCGITGTHISVTVNGEEENEEMHHHHEHTHEHTHEHEHEHEHSHEHGHTHTHHHSSMHDIEHILSHISLPQKVREDVLAVYGLIAEAESAAHGVPMTQIHFHEVGTMDAVADVSAVCLLMDRLSPDEVIVSPVHVGSGQVKCAHGILPVPAPATAYILKDVPIYGGEINGELCTPTGAALLKHFATRFGAMPVMKTQAIGYGMGKKDFPAANCVRAMLGETADKTDEVSELSCNVDDMTAEEIGFAMERLFEVGALEVYTVPIGMKKSRPGILLRVMCKEQDRENLLSLIFKHTTTIGVRETATRRYILDRSIETLDTPYGTVHIKKSCGYGVSRVKYEYDDLARIAAEKNISIEDARRLVEEQK
ncbi:MAG: nickel pincer cofactor biosynthesis protein LarC [Eubacterium sp.]|nr:nickel pincer cofactor biosynthesis protein LarC [Eubacterium sp.]